MSGVEFARTHHNTHQKKVNGNKWLKQQEFDPVVLDNRHDQDVGEFVVFKDLCPWLGDGCLLSVTSLCAHIPSVSWPPNVL